MPPRRVTSYDVADLAGTSQSAVSRAFSVDGSVSPGTRERILVAAERLGYRPNAIARSLGRGRSGLLGVVVNQHPEQGHANALSGVTEMLRGSGGGVLLQVVDADALADDSVTALLDYRVEAIVCSSVVSASAAERCADAGVALCLVNRCVDSARVDEVLSDNAGSSAAIARGLASAGRSRTAFLYGPPTGFVGRLRFEGFAAGCAEAGLGPPAKVHCDFTYRGGHDATLALLAERPDVDAVAAATDGMALGAMDALRHGLGRRVPDDVMVVGHDDEAVSGQLAYRLTTVRQPMGAMLERAVELARERAEAPGLPGRRLVMDSAIVLRDSARW